MADAAGGLLDFPPSDKRCSAKRYDQLARQFSEALDQWDHYKWKKAGSNQDLLSMLDPAKNSLAYVYALRHQHDVAHQDATQAEAWLNLALIFCVSFDPVQMRYAGEAFYQILETVVYAITDSDAPDFTTVVTALLRLDPTAGTFTSMHLLILRRCLSFGIPSQALPLLDRDIYAFPHRAVKYQPDDNLSEEQDLSTTFMTAESGFSVPLKTEYVLEYYLLGAQVYIGMRRYARARLFLEHVLLAPSSSHSHSALQIEAYKKWVMIGLLATGAKYPLPRTHDQQVMKSVRAASKAYDSLAEDFEKRNRQKFQAEMDVGSEIWQEDGNQRLVLEASEALLRFRVSDLQKTYVALPVSDVAANLGLSADESLQLLTQMIRNDHLNATIAPANDGSSEYAVLRFHMNASSAKTSQSGADTDLEAQSKRIEDLVTYVRDADRRLQLTKEYIEFQRRQKRTGAGPEGDLAEQMDLSWEAPILNLNAEDGDEDLMAT